MKEETQHKGIRLPKSLIEKVQKSADRETRTFSAQIIHIIKTYYELQEKR